MTDIASYLSGYVEGYWQAYEFFTNPTDTDGVDEGEGDSAGGDADASESAPAPAPGPLPLRGSLPRARASAASRLPAIHQPALSGEGEGIALAAELEAMYVHRGMVTTLSMMVEVFRAADMVIAASICERAVRGIECEVAQR